MLQPVRPMVQHHVQIIIFLMTVNALIAPKMQHATAMALHVRMVTSKKMLVVRLAQIMHIAQAVNLTAVGQVLPLHHHLLHLVPLVQMLLVPALLPLVIVLIMVTKMVVIRAQITHCAMLVVPQVYVRLAFMVSSLALAPSVRSAHRLAVLNMGIPVLTVAQKRSQNVLQMWENPIHMKIDTANFIMQA